MPRKTPDKMIEAGWDSYRRMCVPPDAGEVQVRETRQAFYAGASVLFEGIMCVLEPGEDPTTADMKVFDNLQKEIHAFGQELDRRAFGGVRDH